MAYSSLALKSDDRFFSCTKTGTSFTNRQQDYMFVHVMECPVICFAVNYLIIENLNRFDYFYGNEFKVECPTGSGNFMRLREVAQDLERRLLNLFLPDEDGRRPCHGESISVFL